MIEANLPAGLPQDVRIALADFCAAARQAFGERLQSLVLFGSAAEGRLRATSDVNLLLVLSAFEQARADALREAARIAFAAVRLRPMFVLAAELPQAADAFAVKFQDILARRVVLFGADPFAGLTIARERIVARLEQVLLNTTIRLRATYVLVSLREEQLAREVAETAAPLRACALAMLALQGTPAATPKAALETLSARLPGGPWSELLAGFSDAREDAELPPGAAPRLLLRAIELAQAMQRELDELRGRGSSPPA